MKKESYILSAITIALLALWLGSCKDDNETTPDTASTCQLTKRESSSSTGTAATDYTSSTRYTMEYNNAGLVNRTTSLSENISNAGKKLYSNSGTSDYQYNADGFLTQKNTSSSQLDDGVTVSYSSSTTINYTYTNGRLTKAVSTKKGTSLGTPYTDTNTTTYEYDNGGSLTNYTNTRDYSGANTFSDLSIFSFQYNGGKISSLSIFENSTLVTYALEVNNQGLITRETGDNGYENRYQYDTEGNQTRSELWIKGKKNSVQVFEYDAAKNVGRLEVPESKGHIDWRKLYGRTHQSATHNQTKSAYYSGENETLSTEWLYTYQYHTNGYPLSRTSKYTANGTTSIYEHKYSYTNCD